MNAPPNPVEPLIDATNNAPPCMGWFSFESDYPTVHYDPPWTPPFLRRNEVAVPVSRAR